MKMNLLIGERFKERPADFAIDSHALMVRGGYMKYVANGIFSQYMPLRRITRKIEQIIREEMDAVGMQEVLFPVALPASLWEESGRYESVGEELLRFVDRNENPMVLGMTHEEAAVQLVREYGQSYARYPFALYQIQTKFRDEARPRGGLIRVREFTMKDAYSFHTSQEDLEQYYEQCFQAYERIFARAGIPQSISVLSDSGMMGGSISHEFMLLTPIGEDSIALCTKCDYRANVEAAQNIIRNAPAAQKDALTLTHTPNKQSIEEVCEFLDMPQERSCKAVIYQKKSDNGYVVIFLRGDLEVNETKLSALLGEDVYPGAITPESGLEAGFIGPYALKGSHTVLFDASLAGAENFVCGANTPEHHYVGFCIERDVGNVSYQDLSKIKTGGICPICGEQSINISRGIEIGNIFQLGTKYTQAMDMHYVDQNDQPQYPIMGCYGIGVGRLAASVCEEYHDDYGPIWPISIAPWQVHLCCVRADDEQAHAYADELYAQLQQAHVEVLYDDRTLSAGVLFSEADLLGVPVRVVVSPRNMKNGCCEVTLRDKSFTTQFPLDQALQGIQDLVNSLLEKYL